MCGSFNKEKEFETTGFWGTLLILDAPLDRIHWLGEHIVGVTQSSPQEECDAGFTDLEGCKGYNWDCMAQRMGKKNETILVDPSIRGRYHFKTKTMLH